MTTLEFPALLTQEDISFGYMKSPLLTSLFCQNSWKLALSFFAVLGTGHLILEGRVVQKQKQKIHAQEK